MALHINPINAIPTDNGLEATPEIMVIYGEGTAEFEYIISLIGSWDHYVSASVTLPNATATIQIQSGKVYEVKGPCKAYIYGWIPGCAEWTEGSCVAIVYFAVPAFPVTEYRCVVRVHIEDNIVKADFEQLAPIYIIDDTS